MPVDMIFSVQIELVPSCKDMKVFILWPFSLGRTPEQLNKSLELGSVFSRVASLLL
jgi:hypothetical protein